jgi:S-adenosylmethionine decarboxylase
MKVKITQLVLEAFGCESPLSDTRFIRRVLRTAVKEAKLNELHSYFHRFRPIGVTGVIVLKESHISIHTWPEHGYAAVDLLTCGERKDALQACRSISDNLKAQRIKRKEIQRGIRR